MKCTPACSLSLFAHNTKSKGEESFSRHMIMDAQKRGGWLKGVCQRATIIKEELGGKGGGGRAMAGLGWAGSLPLVEVVMSCCGREANKGKERKGRGKREDSHPLIQWWSTMDPDSSLATKAKKYK